MGSKLVISNQEYNVVGGRPIRHDGLEKVTGQAHLSFFDSSPDNTGLI